MSIGRAKAALVFGRGESATAVITTVAARAPREQGRERLRVAGPVTLSAKTLTHVRRVILPLADRLVGQLGLPLADYEISIANVSAASLHDVGVALSGYSADLPIFLAILSAALGIPVKTNTVSTGHIASLDGDIRMVKDIPAKVQAATADPEIETFLHPVFDRDVSLQDLSPQERERAISALAGGQDNLRTRGIADVAELLPLVFSEDNILQASLRKGFFRMPALPDGRESDRRIVEFIAGELEERFWSALETQLLHGNSTKAKGLLFERVRFAIARNEYPSNLSARLRCLLQSVPPAIRRLRLDFPLLPIDACIRLSQYAEEQDYQDVRQLYDAVEGKGIRRGESEGERGGATTVEAGAALETILAGIDERALSAAVGIPIDNARAGYILDSVTTESRELFFEAIESFHLHLVQHTHALFGKGNPRVESAEAHALLEQAYRRNGGVNAACSDAKAGTNGGMRGVLDAMTAQYKHERQERYIQNFLNQALNPLDWESKVQVVAQFLERLGSALPTDIRAGPPERFADDCAILVRAYVESMERVKSLLR